MATEEVTDGDDSIPGPAPLTPKEEAFCRAFGDPESPSYGRAAASAEAAGYVQARTAGWKIKKRPRVRARLAEYYELARAAVARVLSDLEHERLAALAKGDVASAVRASELQGKHLAMFTDRVGLDLPQVQQLSEARIIEGQRLTRLLLMEGAGEPADLSAPADASGLRTIDADAAPRVLEPGAVPAQGPEGRV